MSLLCHSQFLIATHRDLFSRRQKKPLLGPGHILLDVMEFARLQLRKGTKQTMEKVYVVNNLSTPLLGLPAIVALGVLIRVDSIDMETLRKTTPSYEVA